MPQILRKADETIWTGGNSKAMRQHSPFTDETKRPRQCFTLELTQCGFCAACACLFVATMVAFSLSQLL